MIAIAGPDLSRRAEVLVLAATALVAPAGRRFASALGVWVPVSLAVVVGGFAIA